MKLDDIRPDELVRENLELYAKDLKGFMARSQDFVEVSCPACDNEEWPLIPEFVKNGFAHRKCRRCGTLYISPRPTREMLMDWYNNAESIRHWNERLYPLTEGKRREKIHLPRAAEVSGACIMHDVHRGKLVDVGAGFGTFCELSERHFFTVVIAVEPSHDLAEACRRRGLSVIEEPVERVELELMNVVTAFELIEHLYRPVDFLRKCWRMLAPGGLLYLTTPNVDGFDLATLGELALDINGPNHLQLLTKRALASMLDDAGFELLELDTPGRLDAENVRDAVLRNDYDLEGQPFLIEVLHDRWGELGGPFQEFLADHGMSSHMRAVARRR